MVSVTKGREIGVQLIITQNSIITDIEVIARIGVLKLAQLLVGTIFYWPSCRSFYSGYSRPSYAYPFSH